MKILKKKFSYNYIDDNIPAFVLYNSVGVNYLKYNPKHTDYIPPPNPVMNLPTINMLKLSNIISALPRQKRRSTQTIDL